MTDASTNFILPLDYPLEALNDAAELLAEIMRDEVNAQDEAEKWLRAYSPHLLFSENVSRQTRED